MKKSVKYARSFFYMLVFDVWDGGWSQLSWWFCTSVCFMAASLLLSLLHPDWWRGRTGRASLVIGTDIHGIARHPLVYMSCYTMLGVEAFVHVYWLWYKCVIHCFTHVQCYIPWEGEAFLHMYWLWYKYVRSTCDGMKMHYDVFVHPWHSLLKEDHKYLAILFITHKNWIRQSGENI